jgi:hypothetical protein
MEKPERFLNNQSPASVLPHMILDCTFVDRCIFELAFVLEKIFEI